MSIPAANSSLDVANWFFKKAEVDGWYLETEKLHHLLFLAQTHYALANNYAYLMPSLFVTDENGFTEPGLAKALSFGRPLMPAPRFDSAVNNFLDLIWQKYASMSIRELSGFIKNSASYTENYQPGHRHVVPLETMAARFKSSINPRSLDRAVSMTSKKILISQNGPVAVSKWQPRKLKTESNKENKYV